MREVVGRDVPLDVQRVQRVHVAVEHRHHGGVAHFVSQFGPALKWPWTKLMDVPELTDELVQRIADQSDAQSGHMTIRELERHRDANVASMLLALEERRWGAGNTVAAMRARQAAQH